VTRPPDLRLFGMAAGTWGSSMAAVHASPTSAVWLGAGAAMVAGVLSVLTLRVAPRKPSARSRAVGWAAVAVLLGVVCGVLSTAARTVGRDGEPLASLAHDHVTASVDLTVTDDPRELDRGRPGPPTYLVRARMTRLEVARFGAVTLDVRVIVFAVDDAWRDVLPGQRLTTAARLAPARRGDLTAAVLNVSGPPELVGRPSWTQLAAGRLRAGLQAACAPLRTDAGGLLPGLVVGDTSRLDPSVAEEFRATGLTHLVAVSGANLAIVVGVVLLGARWCRAGPWLSAVVCATALGGFVILARPSPSVLRSGSSPWLRGARAWPTPRSPPP
jgi:competence protein ComEC